MKAQTKAIFGVVKRGENDYWTRIGTAFVNAKDGSINLRFDFLPTDGTATIQVRDIERKPIEAAA